MSDDLQEISPRKWNIAAVLFCVVLAGAVAIAIPIVSKRIAETRQQAADELARRKLEEERLKAELEKAKAEADLAKAKLQQQEESQAAAKAKADADAEAGRQLAKQQAEEKQRLEDAIRERLKSVPAVWALWEEQAHDAIKITATRPKDATLQHKGAPVIAKYEDMPEWLRTMAQAKHQQDGEIKGLIREVDGKIYDLRTAPAGWVALPPSEVIQIVSDGYLLIDVASIQQSYAQTRIFKLKHNGLARILNTGERIQISAKSVGTYDYENKQFEIMRVPVYDPGLPVGPLRDRVVAMRAPKAKDNRPKPSSGEPATTGSGFFISEDGLFITNAHVVEDSTKVEVKCAAGKKSATVLRVDKDKDLAVLRVSVDGAVSALQIWTNNLPIGAQVFTIGYPLVDLQGFQPKFTDGRISSVAGLHDNPEEMQISVAVQPGNSGGPLADNNGDIVGVVVAQLNEFRTMAIAGTIPQNVNYAVKGTTLVRFLKENRDLVPNVRLGRSKQRSQEEAIRLVEKASGMVLAYE